eukprot:jgi/Picsp_1/4843/NSC_02208-R1_mitochondrial ribosomal protein l7 l12
MRRVLACRLWQAGVDIQSLSLIKWSTAVEHVIQMDGKVTLGACARQDNKVAFWRRLSSASGDADETREITNPKVLELADRIVELNMLEVSDLTELLRKRLNVQTPSVPMGFAMPTSSPTGAVSAPVIKEGMKKEDAEELKAKLEAEVQVKVESVDRGNATLLFILAPDYIFLHSNCKDKAY